MINIQLGKMAIQMPISFFFQADDGIRGHCVTGVQTCALPIWSGTIPLSAWTAIKRPYKELMHLLLTLPVHVLICGRQGNDFAEDDASGELKNLGFKMRAEGRSEERRVGKECSSRGTELH